MLSREATLMRTAIPTAAMAPTSIVLLALGAAQTGRIPLPQEFLGEQPSRLGLEAPAERHEFTFTRAAYSGNGWRRRAGWTTDYPKADRQFLIGVKRLTLIDAYGGEHAMRLDDPELMRYPFLYAVEVGRMGLTEADVQGLRRYLSAGGFLFVDDFWGSWQWDVFEAEIRRVLPVVPSWTCPSITRSSTRSTTLTRFYRCRTSATE